MLLSHLLDASIRSLFLALVAAAILWALRSKRSPALAHGVWTVVLCVMLLIFALGPVLPHPTAPIPAAAVVAVRGVAPRAAAGPPAGLAAVQPVLRGPSNPPRENPNWREITSFLYLSIALAFFGRLLMGWLLLWRLLRSSTLISGTQYESPSIAVPLTVGSKILLPIVWREWDDATLAAVLAHEAAHIRRRDSLVAFLAALNRCLFWFHPLAWWLERKLALLAEQACDESSLLAIDNRERYARILLDMAAAVESTRGRLFPHAVAMATLSHIRLRIDNILDGSRRASAGLTKTGWAVLLLCGAPLVLAVAAVCFTAQPAPAAPALDKLTLVENATRTAGVLRLTAAARMQRGAAWLPEKQPAGKGFDATLQFRLTGSDHYFSGANGLAFVIQNSGPTALGGNGAAAGFRAGSKEWPPNVPAIARSLAVFFDTCLSDDNPSGSQVSVYSNRRLAYTGNWLSVLMKDGNVHSARIVYAAGSLSVFLDNPTVPVLTAAVNLSSVVGSDDAYVGFTSATGNGYENHDVLSFSFAPGKPRLRVSCRPNQSLCTPDGALIEDQGSGRYHVILPANLEQGASVPNPAGQPVTISNATGTVCWDPSMWTPYGCNGPAGNGVIPSHEYGSPDQFLAPDAAAGSLITVTGSGRTYFSVNDRRGAAFADNQGYFEFDVQVPAAETGQEIWRKQK